MATRSRRCGPTTGPSTAVRAASPNATSTPSPTPPELLGQTHLDHVAEHPHGVRRHRPHRRRRLRGAVADVETRPVARTLEQVPAQPSLTERPAVVRAPVGEGVEVAPDVAHEQCLAVDDAAARPAGSDLADGYRESVAGLGVTHRTGTRRARGGSVGCAAPGGPGTAPHSHASACPLAPVARRRRPVATRGVASVLCRRRTR